MAAFALACATPRAVVAPSPAPVAAPVPPPPDPHAEIMKQVEPIRAEAKELLKKQTELYWENKIHGKPFDVAETYVGHERLISTFTLSMLRDARRYATSDEARALTVLDLSISGQLLAAESAAATDEFLVAEADAKLTTTDAAPFRKLDRLLAMEASADERARIYASARTAVTALTPLAAHRREFVQAAFMKAGYASSTAFETALCGTTPAEVSAIAERFLASTDAMYQRALDHAALEELAIPAAKIRPSDVPRLFRSPSGVAVPTSEKMLASAYEVFQLLGLDPLTQQGLHIETAASPGGDRTPFLAPFEIPGDVRIFIPPQTGIAALHAAVRTLAMAEMDAHTRRREWEFQHLGSFVPTDAFAIVFEDVINSESPIGAMVHRLFMLRREAARVQFQALLDSPGFAETPVAAYRRVMSRALGFDLTDNDAARYLLEEQPFGESSRLILAPILAVQIERHLAAKFGARWWEVPLTGQELANLWADGKHLTIEDVLKWADAKALDPQPLIDMIANNIAVK